MPNIATNKYTHSKVRFFLSRNFFIFLLLLIETVAFIVLTILFQQQFFAVRIIFDILGILLGLRIIVSKSSPSYKLLWMLLLVIFPIVGIVSYILFAEDKFNAREEKILTKMIAEDYGSVINSKFVDDAIEELNNKNDLDGYNIARYIKRTSVSPLSSKTKTTYFAWGEDAFPVMVEALKKAKHYIFIEYFIIEPGKMWDTILEILKEKVKNGVDVRVFYDDLGCMKTLPKGYCKELASYGIKAMKYSPIKPILSVRMNNRDHRKIMVIDGHTGFTGGINLADEYINEKVRFGRWKDNCLMLEGDGVFDMTAMFLVVWHLLDKKSSLRIDYSKYLPSLYKDETKPFVGGGGYVQSYCSVPFLYESIGQNVYIDIALKAKKYLYISTPYLILDDELTNALRLAAKNGVDVRIITPHIPDKKLVFEVTRSNYKPLLRAGVKIYEYLPGFIHAKTFVCDDIMATVGTINLDYRSLYLHLENGTFIYKEKSVLDIKNDFLQTFIVSKEWTLDDENKIKWYRRLFRSILTIFAPLL